LIFAPISVVIPCYIATSTLRRAVDSVIKQSLPPFELILIDDASDDCGKTKQLISDLVGELSLTSKILVKTIYLSKNIGPGPARNLGWNYSSQEWVAFLDADDAWDVNKIKIQYECAQKNPEADLLAHSWRLIDVENKAMNFSFEKITYKVNKINLFQMLVSNAIPTRTVRVPLRFPESDRYIEDYFLWLEFIVSGYSILFIDCPLAITFKKEFTNTGYSGKLWIQEKRELNTLRYLYAHERIGIMAYVFFIAWSYLKFLRRIVIRYVFK
jgi:glycosyltransferase involved in cell wall biosynthesis